MPLFYCGLLNNKMFCLFIMTSLIWGSALNRISLWQLSMIYSILSNFVETIFAMVDEAKFMLFHRPYIGNFDQRSDWSGNDKHFSKKFWAWTKYFELGSGVGGGGGYSLKKHLIGFVQFTKRSNKVLRGGGEQLAPFAFPCGRLCVHVFKHQLQFGRHQNTAIDEILDVLFWVNSKWPQQNNLPYRSVLSKFKHFYLEMLYSNCLH